MSSHFPCTKTWYSAAGEVILFIYLKKMNMQTTMKRTDYSGRSKICMKNLKWQW